MLHLMTEAHPANVPTIRFDEELSLNVISGTGLPLASSNHLLATATKTEAAPERDDADPDYSSDIMEPSSRATVLATLTKTSAEKESDDSD